MIPLTPPSPAARRLAAVKRRRAADAYATARDYDDRAATTTGKSRAVWAALARKVRRIGLALRREAVALDPPSLELAADVVAAARAAGRCPAPGCAGRPARGAVLCPACGRVARYCWKCGQVRPDAAFPRRARRAGPCYPCARAMDRARRPRKDPATVQAARARAAAMGRPAAQLVRATKAQARRAAILAVVAAAGGPPGGPGRRTGPPGGFWAAVAAQLGMSAHAARKLYRVAREEDG